MGCVELNEMEERIVKNCNKFLWNQRVVNHAESIISYCEDDNAIKSFFKECELKVKERGSMVRKLLEMHLNKQVFQV
jgi:hypothetical protein